MKKLSHGWKGLLLAGLLIGFSMGNVASARPSGPLGTYCAYLGWLIGGLHGEAGLQAAGGARNAGNHVAVAKYYTHVAYNYAVAGYYIPN